MKTFYLKNVRRGFATNSSSTHSVIYQNKEKLLEDLDVLEQDFYDRYDSTIAASKKAKIKYVAANIFWNKPLFDIMCEFYPSMKEYIPLIEKQKKSDEYLFGMYHRGNLYFDNNKNLEASVEYLRNVIDNDNIVIVGGSDEQDFVYDIKEGHKEIEIPSSFGEAYKNGNYWVCYDSWGKARLNNTNTDCIPAYPELIDLCITKSCQHACQFCFDANTMIDTVDGQKKITDIKEGDLVFSFNQFNYEFQIKPVDEIYERQYKGEIIEITLENDKTLKCTPNHKLYTINRGWVKAEDLDENDDLLTF